MRKTELLNKSREAMLSAVQIYNNPQIKFKSESFITLAIISWTYLLHAFYKMKGIDYRYFSMTGKRKKYDRTKYGAFKHWELERCLNDKNTPLDIETTKNLKFLIGIRHEIEHQMTKRIDDSISAKLQACSLNYNYYIKKLFDNSYGIDNELGLAIQFSPITYEQKDTLLDNHKLPKNMCNFIMSFESNMDEKVTSSERYAYRVVFTKILANRVGQADKVVQFIHSDSPLAKNLNKEYVHIKETEKEKYLPGQIVSMMHNLGYKYFSIQKHTELWKGISSNKGDLQKQGLGIFIAGKKWMWYKKWVTKVTEHCEENSELYKYNTNFGNAEIGYLESELISEIRRYGFNKFNEYHFKNWRKSNSIDKHDIKYGMVNVKGIWMWKKRVLDNVKEFCKTQGRRFY